MPIIDNSSHLLSGLFWQEKKKKKSGPSLLSIAPKGPVERNNRNPNSQKASGALARAKLGLLVIFIPQVVPATLDSCATVPRSTEPVIRQCGPSETVLQQGRLLQLPRLLQIPKMEKTICMSLSRLEALLANPSFYVF